MIYPLIKPLLFSLDAERAHRMTIAGLKGAPSAPMPPSIPHMAQNIAGLDFPNPLGIAPGFDKNAEVPRAILGLGFGAVEMGTVTPLPQQGNPRPRLFRLVKDKAVINRMGFNNDGADAVVKRLENIQKFRGHSGIFGVNIGANKDSDDRINDYAIMTRKMAHLADYLTINISSPNTPGLRALQDSASLERLINVVADARQESGHNPPIFLKLAPDLSPEDIADIAKIALSSPLAALIISNTTIARPDHLQSRHKDEAGGLSGAPLREMALQRLRDFYAATKGQIPLIGVGGIANADDAWQRITAGASLIQLYSAMVYHGPSLAKDILSGLNQKMQDNGIAHISDAIGVDAG